eukprot:9730587-Alexandrium_andersonii.AAC.1
MARTARVSSLASSRGSSSPSPPPALHDGHPRGSRAGRWASGPACSARTMTATARVHSRRLRSSS